MARRFSVKVFGKNKIAKVYINITNKTYNIMEKYFDDNQVNEILEAAYLAGFEKSEDNLSIKDEFKQALNFLTIKIL